MRLPISIDRHLSAVKLVLTSLAVSVLLAACGAPGGGGIGPGAPGITGSTGNVKVAVLLPISSSGSTGQPKYPSAPPSRAMTLSSVFRKVAET